MVPKGDESPLNVLCLVSWEGTPYPASRCSYVDIIMCKKGMVARVAGKDLILRKLISLGWPVCV